MPRKRRSPSRSRCARRSTARQDGGAGHARPRACAPRGGGARTLAGAQSTIPAATRSPTQTPACSPGSPPRPRCSGLEPVTLLALLKHPLLRLGAGEDAHRAAISVLERAVLRGPRPRAGRQGWRMRWPLSAPAAARCMRAIRGAGWPTASSMPPGIWPSASPPRWRRSKVADAGPQSLSVLAEATATSSPR